MLEVFLLEPVFLSTFALIPFEYLVLGTVSVDLDFGISFIVLKFLLKAENHGDFPPKLYQV